MKRFIGKVNGKSKCTAKHLLLQVQDGCRCRAAAAREKEEVEERAVEDNKFLVPGAPRQHEVQLLQPVPAIDQGDEGVAEGTYAARRQVRAQACEELLS